MPLSPLRDAVRVLLTAAVVAQPAPLLAQQRVDILLRGGTVIDGTGSARRRADVGITGDRIAFIGDAAAGDVAAGSSDKARCASR